MYDQITLVGLNHRTASVDIREKFSLANFCSEDNWSFPCGKEIKESLILSTCNRVEIIGVGTETLDKHILNAWAKITNSHINEITPFIYSFFNGDAVNHIFSVAASIDSMVVGEPQILGQLKKAYKNSVQNGHSGIILNRMLHKSFSVAKRVRNETAIAANAVSISYAAVELAKRIFGEMSSHKALLVGAGEMAELAALHLMQAGINEIVVANRTLAHAEQLARRFSGRVILYEKLIHTLPEVDIVLTSTGSTEPILKAEDIKNILKLRKNRPMFFIDIAVPRDIDPAINQLDNVYLYDIDDLKEVVQENISARHNEAEKAKQIISEEVKNFLQWLENLKNQPIILELIAKGQRIVNEEVEKTLRRHAHDGSPNREVLTTMANSIINKMNHDPIMFLKNVHDNEIDQNEKIALVKKIFGLESKSYHLH